MTKQEFKRRVEEARRIIVTGDEGICCALPGLFPEEIASVPIAKGDAKELDVGGLFPYFFAPRSIRGTFWKAKRKNGYDGRGGYWLGDFNEQGTERRLLYLDMWAQWTISFGYYRQL